MTDKQYVLGRGKLYVAINEAGERYLGNTPGFTLSVETETLDHFSDDEALSERDASTLLSVTRSATVSCDNISIANLGLFIIGDIEDIAQTATTSTITDDAITVMPGYHYQLGGAATPVRQVSDVSLLKGETSSAAWAVNTDYRVDEALGRIEILTTGNISAGNRVRMRYRRAANAWQRVSSATRTQKGAVRYLADNAQGPNYDVYMPSCIIQPSGVLSLKARSEWAQMEFNLNIQMPAGGGAALIIDGRNV